MLRRKITSQASSLVLLSSAMITQPLLAQDDALVLEEVVVTAQKREESLTEAPLTVNLLSADSMNDAAVFDASELGKLTAGVEIRFEGDSNSGVGIRGVGTFAQQSAPPRVSTYMDGYFIGSQQDFAFASMYDMKQVQVLRGPQGTLYGQPSPTGAIIMETADPNLEEVEGHVKASYQADPAGYNAQAAVSVPIIDGVLGARVAILSDERESGIENITQRFDEERGRDGARVKLLWEPTDSLSAKFAYSYLRTKDSGTYIILESTDPASDFQLDAADRTALADSPDQLTDKKDFLMTLNLVWDAEWGTINWFSGDFGSNNLRPSDDDSTQYTALSQDDTFTKFRKNVQHELRISMSPTDWWDTQFGGFSQNSLAQTTVRSLAGIADTGVFEIDLNIPTGNKTDAIFTHNDFHISDSTTLTVGLRYNVFDADAANFVDNRFGFGTTLESDNSISGTETAALDPALPCVGDLTQDPPCENRRKEKDKEWTGTVKLSHSFNEALNMYATIDHGFRPGAPNFDVNGSFQATPEDPTSGLNFFGGETVDSIEIGAKGDIWEGRGQYTSSVFYTIYEDYQLRPSFDAWNSFSQGGAVTTISNADVNVDEAEQIGAEFELRYLATENLELFGSVTYAQVELTDGVVPCTDDTQEAVSASNRFNVCNADGLTGGIQPEWYVTAKANYSLPIDAIGGSWYLNGLVNYRSEIDVPGDTAGTFASDDYTTVDLFTGIRADIWEVQLYFKNVFDEEGILARRPLNNTGTAFATAVGGTALYNELSVTPPRSIGITGSYYF
ncbi:MAG: TonB-dependent receptor [Pseudomonadales bacterium]